MWWLANSLNCKMKYPNWRWTKLTSCVTFSLIFQQSWWLVATSNKVNGPFQIFSNFSWLSFEGNFKYSSSLGAGVILRSTELQRFPSKLKIFSEVYRHKVFPYKLSQDQEMFSPLTKRALTLIKNELCITWEKGKSRALTKSLWGWQYTKESKRG